VARLRGFTLALAELANSPRLSADGLSSSPFPVSAPSQANFTQSTPRIKQPHVDFNRGACHAQNRRQDLMRIFFATDVHGSEVCWKKFISAASFYGAETLILGGDMTGKAIIPIIDQGNGKYKVTLLEQESMLDSQEAVEHMVQNIKNRGYYPYLTDPDETAEISNTPGRSDELFLQEAMGTMQKWMEYADAKLEGTGIRCYVCPGNDDMFEIDEVIAASKHVRSVEGQVISLDDYHEMASSGWSNPTPWDTHREESEEALEKRLEAVINQVHDKPNSVFNFHPPPYGSGLDEAPELTADLRLAYAGRSMVSVGSKAVLKAVETYKPLLTLHGHIHEGKGSRKYGRTLCLNPGSMYEQGVLHGALVDLEKNKIGTYVLTTG
jgi:Icc-related predicted phosphoesterase